VKAQLHEVTNADATVMAFASAIVTVVAGVAGLPPARRAASIDPIRALRTE
jgi:ABC-type antimicrobial peptide transport system permease subunit